jgi:hypothetical protein
MQARKIRTHVAALMLLAPAAAFLAPPAAAQQQRAPAPTITSLAVNADAGLAPGSTLRFQLYARSNAQRADVVLGDSGVVVPLRQRTPGNYTGTYTVRRNDRIDPLQMMAARVTHSGRTIARNFSYPPAFQALAMGAGPAPVAAPRIASLVMRPAGRVEPGRELRFRLEGAPGGDAWLDIPGVINGIDLAETRPGVYEGNYTVRRRDNLAAFERATATLRAGNRQVTAQVDNVRGDRGPRDDRAPQITSMSPAHGERVAERGRTQISARLSDEGSGIDPASVRLRLAGRDVTSEARVNDNEISYRADMEPGRYTAELSARDFAGNQTTKTWTFDVAERERDRDRVGAGGPLPLQVTSHNSGDAVDPGGNVALAGRTAPFATVRVQVESNANLGGVVGVTRPVMDQTLQADRNGYFNVPVPPNLFVIPGARWDVRLTATSGSQTAEERLTLHRRG